MSDVLHYPCTSSSAEPVESVRPPELSCRMVADPADLVAHHRIRHEVFVVEQGLFADSDEDTHDTDPRTVHLIGLIGKVPAGTVRLWPRGDGTWKGDRLAVVRGKRHIGLGRPLVQLAVRTAAGLGGSRMHAQVQVANVQFFQTLGWACDGAAQDYLGAPHQHMSIELR